LEVRVDRGKIRTLKGVSSHGKIRGEREKVMEINSKINKNRG
jgi:hypothetical protein